MNTTVLLCYWCYWYTINWEVVYYYRHVIIQSINTTNAPFAFGRLWCVYGARRLSVRRWPHRTFFVRIHGLRSFFDFLKEILKLYNFSPKPVARRHMVQASHNSRTRIFRRPRYDRSKKHGFRWTYCKTKSYRLCMGASRKPHGLRTIPIENIQRLSDFVQSPYGLVRISLSRTSTKISRYSYTM